MNPPPDEKSQKQLSDGMKFLTGMAGVGAGAGLLGVLYDTIRSQRRKAKARDGDPPNALGIYLPPQEKSAVLAQALAGIATAGLTGAGVLKLYRDWKKRKLQDEVDEASLGYLGTLTSSKQASGMLGQILTDLPSDAMVLLPAAAAAGSYGLLEHVFPRAKEKRKAGLPRNIVVKGWGRVEKDGPGDGPLADMDAAEAAAPKLASCSFGKNDMRNCAELLTLFVLAAPHMKEANAMTELLGFRVSSPAAFTAAFREAGSLGAISAAKGRSQDFWRLDAVEKRAAVRGMCRDAVAAPSFVVLALSELAEQNVDTAKLAFAVLEDDEETILLTKFASVFHAAETGALLAGHEKLAAVPSVKSWQKELSAVAAPQQDGAGEDDADTAYAAEGDPIDDFMIGRASRTLTA